ncbi:carbohydrate ABC transporter membrane protein 1, CUT1 family [Caloramator quimbayensis]|uniref:Carbohydrate ABC transporter membrane protein 1, CUT1 family n=1 Tax=Caloramator quimbayensis TaxID=1147123 RepID=A0A1T4XVP6_9CLOT|nr:sugar ABC transporter permease [Caloramator quimbayensis]SKA93632.1 carbohydrate ABC transporter membrane protein 1, CUT1 family [Caloramator quimbayensis]
MRKISISDKIGMILFLAPAVILFTVFFVYPVGFILVTSFTEWDGMSSPVFVGLRNYTTIFKDPIFRLAIRNNIGWVIAGGFIQVPLAVIVALMLSKKPFGWKALRTIYYFPNVISTVSLSMMWMAVYNSEYGILNGLLKILGLGHLQRNWLGDLHTAFYSVVLYGVFYIGYFMIILLADISSIPKSYYEAASIDGATKIQQDFYITLPMIKGTIGTCMTVAMVYGLRQFEQTYVMTNGGPANKTMVMVLYLFKKIGDFKYGIADASAVVLLLIGSLVILTVKRIFRTENN